MASWTTSSLFRVSALANPRRQSVRRVAHRIAPRTIALGCVDWRRRSSWFMPIHRGNAKDSSLLDWKSLQGMMDPENILLRRQPERRGKSPWGESKPCRCNRLSVKKGRSSVPRDKAGRGCNQANCSPKRRRNLILLGLLPSLLIGFELLNPVKAFQ